MKSSEKLFHIQVRAIKQNLTLGSTFHSFRGAASRTCRDIHLVRVSLRYKSVQKIHEYQQKNPWINADVDGEPVQTFDTRGKWALVLHWIITSFKLCVGTEEKRAERRSLQQVIKAQITVLIVCRGTSSYSNNVKQFEAGGTPQVIIWPLEEYSVTPTRI